MSFMGRCLIILSSILFSSCVEQVISYKYSEGECIEEKDTRFIVPDKKLVNPIYRVDKTESGMYHLSRRHNNTWLNMLPRKRNYFSDSEKFKYEIVECPKNYEEEKNSRLKEFSMKKKSK